MCVLCVYVSVCVVPSERVGTWVAVNYVRGLA